MRIRLAAALALIALAAFVVVLIVLADGGHARWLFARVGRTPGADKFGHFILFGGLSFLANVVGRARVIRLWGWPVLKWSAVLAVLAGAEEFSQLFFRCRSFDLLDLAAGLLGIWCLGALAARWLRSVEPPPTA